MKASLLCLLAVPLFASDSLSNFAAVCAVDAVASATDHHHVTYQVPCHSQDRPAPGFNNHWTVTLLYPVNMSLPETADYVEARTIPGGYKISSILWGSVEIKAQDPTVASQFVAGSREVRPQRITVTPTAAGTVILIQEYARDFDGRESSNCWKADHELAVRLLSDAH